MRQNNKWFSGAGCDRMLIKWCYICTQALYTNNTHPHTHKHAHSVSVEQKEEHMRNKSIFGHWIYIQTHSETHKIHKKPQYWRRLYQFEPVAFIGWVQHAKWNFYAHMSRVYHHKIHAHTHAYAHSDTPNREWWMLGLTLMRVKIFCVY